MEVTTAQNIFNSVVRTLVPMVVGGVMSFLATYNLPVPEGTEAALTTGLMAVFSIAWYLLSRLLETYVTPKFGWLLGSDKSPDSYSDETPTSSPVSAFLVDPDTGVDAVVVDDSTGDVLPEYEPGEGPEYDGSNPDQENDGHLISAA